MSDDNIITLYECHICHAQYRKKEFCLRCVESHNGELIVREIELSTSMHSTNLQDYKFFGCTYRCKADFTINNNVSCLGLYGGWPHFRTECLDTPEEVLKAKRRLLEAAIKWANEYTARVKELQAELEQGGDGK